MPDVVVARLEEPVDWLIEVPSQYRVVVMCFKDKPAFLPRPAECIQIKDAGQECGAYVQYILQHYHDLPDFTVFTQARHDDHTRKSRSLPQALRCFLQTPPTGFEFIGDRCTSSANDPLVKRVWRNHTPHPAMTYSTTPLRDACKYLLDHDCPDHLDVAFGAIFAAPKRLILKHPLSFWKKMDDWCNHSALTVEAAIAEKIWPIILKD